MRRAIDHLGNMILFGSIAIGSAFLARYFFGLSITTTKPGSPTLFWAIVLAMISGSSFIAIAKELLALAKKMAGF